MFCSFRDFKSWSFERVITGAEAFFSFLELGVERDSFWG